MLRDQREKEEDKEKDTEEKYYLSAEEMYLDEVIINSEEDDSEECQDGRWFNLYSDEFELDLETYLSIFQSELREAHNELESNSLKSSCAAAQATRIFVEAITKAPDPKEQLPNVLSCLEAYGWLEEKKSRDKREIRKLLEALERI